MDNPSILKIYHEAHEEHEDLKIKKILIGKQMGVEFRCIP
jgi:hypothetical protein